VNSLSIKLRSASSNRVFAIITQHTRLDAVMNAEVSTNSLTLPFSLLYTRLRYGESLAGRRSKRLPVERVAMGQKHEIYGRPVDQPSQARRPILNLELSAHTRKSTLREK
jgi:hypothetical protein